MIVKDEETSVESALDSASKVVDDIVVVDTGSTDKTPAIARKFTSRVYTFPWKDDFAAARNFAIEHVRTDWMLWLDADEQLDVTNAKRWQQSFAAKARDADALLIKINNYFGAAVDELKMHTYGGFRLLRTAAKLRYKNPIHEHLDVSRDDVRLDYEPVEGVLIRHFGYMDAPVKQKDKYARNMRLLEKERNRPDYDPWIDYHIAGEYYRQGDYVKAFENVQKSLKRFLDSGRLPPSLAYKLKYELLLITGSTENALTGIQQAIQLYPDYVDLHYYKGLFEYNAGRYEDAVKTFATCLKIGESNRYLTLKGAGSFMATYMLGMCWEAMGQREKAMNIYEKLVQQFPTFEPPLARLQALRSQKEDA